MAIGAWSTLLIACVAGGAALCASLIVVRRWVWAFAVVGVVAGFGIGAGMTSIWRATGRADTLVASGFLGLGAFVGGFALLAAVLSSMRPRERTVHPIPRPAGDGLIHVILLADAEPEEYDPWTVMRVFADLDASDVPVPPDAARVLVYASERARYRQIGRSPARAAVRSLAIELSMKLDASRFAVPIPAAFCSGKGDLADAIAEAAGRGADRIVVARLAVARSRAFDEAERRADALKPDDAGVRLAYTSGLWSADGVIALVCDRVLEPFSGQPTDTDGAVLVSEGQPWQWDSSYPESEEQATFFRQRVRAELVERGMKEDNVRPAWIDWTEPSVTEVVRHLAALGARRIAVVPATMPFDTVSTLLDLRSAAEQSAVDPGVEVRLLPAWGDAEAVCSALAARIEDAAAELDEQPAG